MKVQLINYAGDKGYTPEYATPGSAAFDLRAAVDSTVAVKAGRGASIPSGIGIHTSDPYTAGLILPRSGLGTRGLVLANSIGLIDSDYTGEIMLNVINRNVDGETIFIEPGQRIAQMLIINVCRAEWVAVSEVPETERGGGGFGSTGDK